MKVRYVGPLDAIWNAEIEAETGLESVKRGDVVEVSEELATRLLEQRGMWETAESKGKRGKAADAGESPATDGDDATG